MFEKYSSEYAGVLTLVLTQLYTVWFSAGCAEELSTATSVGITALITTIGGYLLKKRNERGGVTLAGFRK